MEYVSEFFTIALLHLLAVMSPGPDFVLISRNSLIYSRKAGVYSAIGLALGVLVHITYSLIGLAYIISQSIIVFSIFKYVGAAYLIYIGLKSLLARSQVTSIATSVEDRQFLSNWQAVKIGFLTNALNPKATLFFLALFSQVIDAGTPLFVKSMYGIEMAMMTFAWFSLVSVILSHRLVKNRFTLIQRYVERTMGGILILFGIKVAFSKN